MAICGTNIGIQGGYDDPIVIKSDTTVVVEKIVYRGGGGTLKPMTERIVYRDPVFPQMAVVSDQDTTDVSGEIIVINMEDFDLESKDINNDDI